MLAILQIKMKWTKENRTPKGSAIRERYYKPMKIEDDVCLSGEGVFIKKCEYDQQGDVVLDEESSSRRFEAQWKKENRRVPFAASDENEQRGMQRWKKRIQRNKGSFCPLDKIEIPCVAVTEESDGCYRIKWSDERPGRPKRRGGNEDLYRKGAKLCGRVNTCNETAFLLREGEAGILKYNYRMTYYQGQWYECYYIYAVNTKELYRDVFLRKYDYEYNQLADLF